MPSGSFKVPARNAVAELLISSLLANQSEMAFCVPGESYLPVLDSFFHHQDRLPLITCRQEGGAAMMAEAWAKTTGKPGLCFVTRGPGATNASAGLHIARQDSTPLILFIGQVGDNDQGREAFQEINYDHFYAGVAKKIITLRQPHRIPEQIAAAFSCAAHGRPGPVVVVMPEDIFSKPLSGNTVLPIAATQLSPPAPAPKALTEFSALLDQASQPLLLIGGARWSQATAALVGEVAQSWQIPVVTAFRCQDYVADQHPAYIGQMNFTIAPHIQEAFTKSDLVIVLGAELDEVTTQSYRLFPHSCLRSQNWVHIYPDAEILGRVSQPDLAIISDSHVFLQSWQQHITPPSQQKLKQRQEQLQIWSERQSDWCHFREDPENANFTPGDVVAAVMSCFVEQKPILAHGAGNYAIWVARYGRFSGFRSLLAPRSGSMGYGLPAAIAAALALPDKMVITFAGDGCFLMHGQELATACQYKLPILCVILDNGMYGTIRMHQEKHFPGHVMGTPLENPDFSALAQAYGARSWQVQSKDELVSALEEIAEYFSYSGFSHLGRPAILHCLTTPDILSPDMRITI